MNKPKFFLDSGAFTAWTKGKTIDINQYIQFVKENKNDIVSYVTLDVIGDVEASWRNQKIIEDAGLTPLPVYHSKDSLNYLHLCIDKYDYFCIGGMARGYTKEERRVFLDKCFRVIEKSNTKCKVHGLGLTDMELMTSYPWYSIDSFTPVISAVWGAILLPEVLFDKRFDYGKLSVCRISDQANHKSGMSNSFLGLPLSVRQKYMELIKENEFELGDILYQVKRPRRGQSNEGIQTPLFDLTKPSVHKGKTLANHWEERMRWNLTMWVKLQQLIPQTIMYMGVSTTTHLRIFSKVEPRLNILVSYAYMSKNLHEQVKEYIK